MKKSSPTSVAIVALVLALYSDVTVFAQTIPSGCLYENGVFRCDYRFCTPLEPSMFDPSPQRLVIYNIDGGMNNTMFPSWSTMNRTGFDSNYDASLSLSCLQGGGVMELTSAAFDGMDIWQNIDITNCEIPSLPSRAFSNFGTVNRFGIQGGSILAVQGNAMSGLTVRRDPNSVSPSGELSIIDVEFPSSTFPDQFLSTQESVTTLTIHRSGLTTVPGDFLSHMVNLTTLSLDNNEFTELPDTLFKNLNALTTLNAGGIHWDCSCDKLWWIEYVANHGMRITSEMLCYTPLSYYGQKTTIYYTNACGKGLVCDEGSLPAVNLADVTCLTYLQIFIYTLAVLGFIGMSAVGGCWLHTRRQLKRNGGGGGGGGKGGFTPRRNRVAGAPGGGRAAPPGTKAGW
ncbi:leucine-rich repeat-containing protein 15 [Elysia marginata]|uniref:Leucine-rich repeat-containing protein 15 n=1 Tax=Elysia marginata TaxID=1093978 RepID=A0AAV4EFY3_9GAST|nr:leucine-rich repeat-containing protein 15 [Elysia marginata]